MKSTMRVCLSLIMVTVLTLNTAEAQGRGKGKGKKGDRPAAGNAEVNKGNAQQMRNRERNGVGDGAQLAQMMIAQFDKDGDNALNAV